MVTMGQPARTVDISSIESAGNFVGPISLEGPQSASEIGPWGCPENGWSPISLLHRYTTDKLD